MKQIIRLTESDLHRIVKESVQRILAETDASAAGGGALGVAYCEMVHRETRQGADWPRVDHRETMGQCGFWNAENQ